MRNLSKRFPAAAALVVALLTACSKDTPATPALTPTTPAGADLTAGIPPGWGGSTGSSLYSLGLDRTDRHGGAASAFITGTSSSATTFATISQFLRADTYRGKRIRWSAWVKQQNLATTDAGLWMRVDGPGLIVGFDNMQSRALQGTVDWHQVSVVLDVPQNAIGIALGVLMGGSGTLLVDDASLVVVGTDVPVTGSSQQSPLGVDSVAVASAYSRDTADPINLDFEGPPTVSSQAVAWLAANVISLNTTDPTASLDDLQPLVNMFGSAHLIGLGEDTHGTREFFRMKHRMLELLVKQTGATYFAIEATSPESDDMNQYVLNGAGDPKVLLSRLYFWTWNTQEVLDMIQWMRAWNATAPAAQRVQFRGFDMQSPGASMDSVAAFIARVDPSQSAVVTQTYLCLASYRNHAQLLGALPATYAALPAATKAACAAGLQQVYNLIDGQRAAYTAKSSSTAYESVLHHARLVQQFETMASFADATQSSYSRDQSMAENIGWIRDHAPAGARIVLWAHNAHINSIPQLMGGYLRANYGADYVNLGFAFGRGKFNAVGLNAQLQPWDAELVPANALEAAFLGTGTQLALLDARTIAGGGAAAEPLAGPIPMRSIGALFDPTSESAYFGNTLLPSDFNLILYVNQTSASTLLPFNY